MRYLRLPFVSRPIVSNNSQAVDDLRKYLESELRRIEETLRMPSLDGAHFMKQGSIPNRYADGDVFYFLAGVAGTNEGFYGRVDGAWREL